MKSRLPNIIKADNDVLTDEEGHNVIDLFSANGTTLLGHCNPAVMSALHEQLKAVWITGGLGSPIVAKARQMVESFFPATHYLGGFYSTGMEAAEFAMRIARCATGKTDVIGFDRAMHGKSLATACLGWNNTDRIVPPHIHRLPFLHDTSESAALDRLKYTLMTHPVSAVFVEPMHASGGGHFASPDFYHQLNSLCHSHGALVVFDEILTGFYRTGQAFVFSTLGFTPDIVLVGKAMGNGFPVSGVVVNRDISIVPDMLPSSTFAGNPLAAAAVTATLEQLRKLDLPRLIQPIEKSIVDNLQCLEQKGFSLRGKGAVWIIEANRPIDVSAIATAAYRKGAFANFTGRQIRVLPAATIRLDNLKNACRILVEAVDELKG